MTAASPAPRWSARRCKRLLADIEAQRVDVVVVYKIDRLSRALMDFAKLVEVFDRNSVTFVSVTQSFNTTTSMGRLTLNILLSFAQFEREVIGERIRDKFAASRKKGMWMGGFVPLGYDVKDRKLVVNEADAKTVRMIFERFIKIGSATTLVRALRAEGVTGKYGKLVDKGYIYKLLNNRTYIGQAVHKGTAYPGEHEAIISQALWDKVHSILADSPRQRAARTRAQTPALLKGLIFGPTGRAMTPTHTRKGGKLYRYYVSTDVLKRDADACTVRRVPAAEIESAVIEQVRGLLRSPEIIVRTWRAAREHPWTVSPKPMCARRCSGSIRSGTNCSRPSRRGSSSCWSSGSMSPRTAPTSDCEPKGLTKLVADLGAIKPEARRAA